MKKVKLVHVESMGTINFGMTSQKNILLILEDNKKGSSIHLTAQKL